jgi:hypothetical protein
MTEPEAVESKIRPFGKLKLSKFAKAKLNKAKVKK